MQLVLLSGGSGKRLWPLSDNSRSKQFLQLLEVGDGSYESMIQRVVRQVRAAHLDADITLATNELQLPLIRQQLGESVSVVTEPARRDTFPAIALAACYLSLEKGCKDDEVVVIMPCDPYTEQGYFETIGKMAGEVARDAAELVLMGITPTYPSPKYGYVVPCGGAQAAACADGGAGVSIPVARFTEKPTATKAQELLSEGALWNGGVFAFRLGYMMNIVRKYVQYPTFAETHANYADFPKISFDYEVAEKAQSVAVVPFTGQWKDLGTWNTLTEELSCNTIGNALLGAKSSGVHVINELGIPVIVEGLENVIVVAGKDGILVCSKDETENIKKYVESL